MRTSRVPALILALSPLVHGQQTGAERAFSVARTPSRLRASAELRGRVEEAGKVSYLQRLRVSVAAEPFEWLHLFGELNDARTAHLTPSASHDPADLRQAFVELRQSRFKIRAGRQELSFADESLLGADTEWCNLGRTFDALSAEFDWGRMNWHAFSGQVVEPSSEAFDRSSTARRISGLYTGIRFGESASMQPFLFRKTTRTGAPRSADTAGIYVSGATRGLEIAGQVAWQHGRVDSSPYSARAASLRVARPVLRESENLPVVYGSFRWASGGPNGRGAFDDLYPAGYNATGTIDPFAWRNLREAGAGAEWSAHRRLTLLVEHRWYWLSSVADGLYTDDGPPTFLAAESCSAHLGGQLGASIAIRISESLRVHAGYRLLRAGPWLRSAGFDGSPSTSFLSVTKRF